MSKPKKVTVTKVEPKLPPPYEPKTPISDMDRHAMWVQCVDIWEQECERYGYEKPMPDHLVKKQDRILEAPDKEMAELALRKFGASAMTHILSAWANGRIDGPVSVHSLEQRIKKTENLAKFLETKGQDAAARTQWDRLESLKTQLEKLQKEQQ